MNHEIISQINNIFPEAISSLYQRSNEITYMQIIHWYVCLKILASHKFCLTLGTTKTKMFKSFSLLKCFFFALNATHHILIFCL